VVKDVTERKKRLEKYKDRTLEKEDKPEVIEVKAKKLAQVIASSKHLICYSGAGISTSAKIPDYRGPQGIWTLLQRGEEIGDHDLSLAEPTLTHMALYELHKRNILKYVVSQNCDGLHLRSGLPRFSLSEVHGNMYVEVCKHCKPDLEYWRIFDTTPLTSRFQHKTNRRCRICANPLFDTIVHFGERGSLKWPLNWSGATKAIEKADVILCLGSSLKVLKKYPWLWALDKPLKQRPKVYIVNLQWTPKDSIADIKINGKCDEVMKIVMKFLNIDVTPYNRSEDPIFYHASLLKEEELHTASQPMLKNFTMEEEDDESTNSVTMSSERQALSTESEDSKLSFLGSLSNGKHMQLSSLKSPSECESDTDMKVKFETCGNVEVAANKNGKIVSIKEEVKEIVDLTQTTTTFEDNCINKNGARKAHDEIVDFEELIDNLEVKVKEQPTTVLVKEEQKTETKEAANIILQQNQNLIDMALLNNSLLTASLAFAPAGTTSKEALTATALILNYNNQIISTLTNNLNLLPYNNGTTTTTSTTTKNSNSNNASQSRSICDRKNNVVFENDIEMCIEESDGEVTKMNTQTSGRITENPEQYYKQLFVSYCKAINDNLPKWSDVNYAYSGLHTIVNLPPEDANLWKNDEHESEQDRKKLRSSTAEERKAAKAECKFCYEKYKELVCQFYKPVNREFKITTYRNNKTIVCECCDYTEDEDEQLNDDENSKMTNDDKSMTNSNNAVIRAGWFGKGK
jgi:NAD+-dependent protein deacetylase sirtuin 7